MASVWAAIAERFWFIVWWWWGVGAVWCGVCWQLLVLSDWGADGGVDGGRAGDGGDRLQVCIGLARLVVAGYWHLGLRLLLVSLALQDLKVGPEDVPHEEGGPGDEVLLVHGAELPPTHGEAGDEAVHVRATAQAELPDSPGEPVRDLLLAPGPGILRDPELLPYPVPGPVCGLENITDTSHVITGFIIHR